MEQLSQSDHLLKQVQSELRSERNKQQECQRTISQLKQIVNDLNNEKEMTEKQIKDLTNKVNILVLFLKILFVKMIILQIQLSY